MSDVFAPGCALAIYKPHLATALATFLNDELGGVPAHTTCCRHEPNLPGGTRIINTCAGCDRRFRELYDGLSTISLWEILAGSETFPFPDYAGATMAIHDACPTRTEDRVHTAVRALLARMNVIVAEPEATRGSAVCCGDSFFGQLPDDRVRELMARRAASMPADDVVVYCVSCVKAMHIGGKRPRYLVDLLFAEDTEPGVTDPAEWHAQLERFIDLH
jgi:Fe-S oxidoreductase